MTYVLVVKWNPIKDGCTDLWIAAKNGHFEEVKYLATEAKVDPNQADKVLSVELDVCDRDVMHVWDEGHTRSSYTHCSMIMYVVSACMCVFA